MGKKKSDNTVSIGYKSIGKKTTLLKELSEVIPKQFMPTNKTSAIFTTIIVIVIGMGVVNAILPIMDISFDMGSEETKEFNLEIKVGVPFQFFGNGIDENEKIKMDATNLIIDLTLYILLAYMLDVIINFALSIKLSPTSAELKRKPKEIKLRKKSVSEKATEKVIEKVAEKLIKKKPVQATTSQTKTPATKQATAKFLTEAPPTAAKTPTTKPKDPRVQAVPKS